MKTLYLQCNMGAAGDMLSAALFDLLDREEKEKMLMALNGLGLPGVVFVPETVTRCGIAGLHMAVKIHGQAEEDCLAHEGDAHCHDHAHCQHTHSHENGCQAHDHHEHHHDHHHECEPPHDHHHHDHAHGHEHHHHHDHDHHHTHHHTSLADVAEYIDGLQASDWVKEQALLVYEHIARAEAAAHNTHMQDIHFHEVGTWDAIADVTAFCMLIEKLAPDQILASPVCTGYGSVHCAHGILPVPAPATARLLEGIPVYAGDIEGELCTPTGAALLKQFVKKFTQMPLMEIEATGMGMGTREFKVCNCVRAFLGSTPQKPDMVVELECNLDDMTPEAVAHAMQELLDHGALDVWTLPAGMKKNRPGLLLQVLCRPAEEEELVKLLFRHTSTLGIRRQEMDRYTLDRKFYTVNVDEHLIQAKISCGYGITRIKYEYEDLAQLARDKGISIDQAKALVQAADAVKSSGF